ncbi:exonuclease SbcCD subunit D C-terminal domain-containing protein [Pseudoalteromonas sp. Cnat2-41]|uniref:exonuclease SbcCD subunit D C-terminal domain-containing protein n=1 Tax=unclassified Pseudoalteromonas TaxID=194690 RepID=UPI001EF8D448|nr:MULTISPECIES: exonuclease SbcCD subunit D C-terminal domain-containing protein [unclassified Pseudoalteromonas]MCF2860739.1 exonuclease SbcCD subunit D C-terminal domain-containing protein [Pseudoalteromonas sp. CNAT2-18]MCG7556608.1 exonuclease SbcCD subunit D C-terminal domain-containing protein [Pseudoalteromonas sp. CNAT2-18.1]
MRLLHTSDWHLGQLFYEHTRVQEHHAFLTWLIGELNRQAVDVLLVSGDIYHTATPPTQAENQLYEFVKAAKAACPTLHIVIIAGNHDSAKRITTAQPLLAQFDTHVVGRFDFQRPELSVINITRGDQHCAILALPYLRASDIPDAQMSYAQAVKEAYQLMLEQCQLEDDSNVIAMGHLHARGATVSEDSERALVIGGEDAIGADVFPPQACYVALGHLHKAQSVNAKEYIRYSGTPFAMSFSERQYHHQVLLLEVQDNALQSVNPLYIPRHRQLHLVPEATLLPLAQVCEQVRQLPGPDDEQGYIRVRLSSKELATDFREQIEHALQGKDLLFCGVERVRSQRESKNDELELQDLSQVERLDAAHLLSEAVNEHDELEDHDITNEVKDLFAQLVEDVEQEGNNED